MVFTYSGSRAVNVAVIKSCISISDGRGRGQGWWGREERLVRDAGGTQRQMSQSSADGTSVSLLLTAAGQLAVCARRGQRSARGFRHPAGGERTKYQVPPPLIFALIV